MGAPTGGAPIARSGRDETHATLPADLHGNDGGGGPRVDVGARLELIYGIEGTTNTEFGFSLRFPIRGNLVRKERFSLLAHADPGIKMYTFSPLYFGFQLPVGIMAAFNPTREVSVGIGADVGFSVGITGPNNPTFAISPMFGPEIEYRIDNEIAVGLNARFGPVIGIGSDDERTGIAGGTVTEFGFRVQLLLAYRM